MRTYHWVQASKHSHLGHSSPYDDGKVDEDEYEGEVKVNLGQKKGNVEI